jgi:hypothetical protein
MAVSFLSIEDQGKRLKASWFKNGPADPVPQPHVIEDKLADRFREELPLPSALKPSGLPFPARHGSRTRGLDGIGRRAKLVGSHMGYHRRLGGSIGGKARSALKVTGRAVGSTGGGLGRGQGDFPSGPGPGGFDGHAGPGVQGPGGLEKAKDMASAVSRPEGKETMVGIVQAPAPADGDEAGITDLGEYHFLIT